MTTTEQKPTYNVRWLVGAFVGLVLVAIVTALIGTVERMPALTVRSDEADGAMALRLWLERAGYEVEQVLSDPIQPDGLDAMFILQPLTPYSESDAERVRAWVIEGNTLIVAGSPFAVNGVLSPYGLSLYPLGVGVETPSATAPTLTTPAFNDPRAEATYMVELGARSDAVVHFHAEGAPVVVSIHEGAGTVWVIGALRPFTNRGLSNLGNASLILNMLSAVPRGGVVGFDEVSHGFGEPPQSVFGWLATTVPGWGVLSALIITGVFVTMRGRRFGKPVPLEQDRLRREPVEYIQALANLFRRSGQREEMLRHYGQQLRRRLTERYAVDPSLSDEQLVRAITSRDPSLDANALLDVLRRLRMERVNEQQLVEAATLVDEWTRRIS